MRKKRKKSVTHAPTRDEKSSDSIARAATRPTRGCRCNFSSLAGIWKIVTRHSWEGRVSTLRANRAEPDRAMLQAPSMHIQSKLEAAGVSISRYGLVGVLLLVGALKFTPGEAAGIQPLVAHSPLMSWMYGLLSVSGVSDVIGVIEIATAVLIALRPLSPKVSFVGSAAGVVTFLLTVSFLFSTPGAAQLRYGFPVLRNAGQFLIKDLVLLGASLWTAAEAHRVAQGPRAWLTLFATIPISFRHR
jgi:uncharacterized membrane protein YkgB